MSSKFTYEANFPNFPTSTKNPSELCVWHYECNKRFIFAFLKSGQNAAEICPLFYGVMGQSKLDIIQREIISYSICYPTKKSFKYTALKLKRVILSQKYLNDTLGKYIGNC